MWKSPSLALVVAGLSALFVALPRFHVPGSGDSDRGPRIENFAVAYAQEQPTVTKFRAQPLYKAAKLSWKAKVAGGQPVTFEIHRSMTNPEGPYTLMASIEWSPGTKKYRYVDKKLPVEENYFYKIVIPATEETFGPLQVRPPFSLPTT
jgi:hypothetical protein